MKKSIGEGNSIYCTKLLFHPDGISLTSQNIAWVSIAIWLPLQALVGGYPAYSLIYIAAFAVNGFVMYLLAREWTEFLPAAFIAGVIFGCWPFALSQSGRPNMILVCWMPLALLHLRPARAGLGRACRAHSDPHPGTYALLLPVLIPTRRADHGDQVCSA